ncbi:DUF169 domain-containing protein [Desulfofalx alkaliphila]|uniref:DUF169 domain-containing protein n=1 Tax=Desulfofalx alkaliphila TaxID=105483 RepID=UPI0004E12F83|nr:DUF169 domain-containing protein [Desulfofalx alkaliphila]
MQSKIAQAIGLKSHPIAVVFTNKKPEGALQFKEGRWGCVVAMFVAASKGRTAVFDRKSFGCIGGGVGLGFGNMYENFPGGIEYFLSTGNKEFCQSEIGKNIVRNMPALEHGEAYYKTPELAKKFIDQLPITDIPYEYVVVKPLSEVAEDETPEVVVFLANCDRLSALFVLANYNRAGGNAVFTPFGAGCHTLCLIPYNENRKDAPRAVLGTFDISARPKLDKDTLSFAIPYKLFVEMESNVEESFLGQDSWARVLQRNKG